MHDKTSTSVPVVGPKEYESCAGVEPTMPARVDYWSGQERLQASKALAHQLHAYLQSHGWSVAECELVDFGRFIRIKADDNYFREWLHIRNAEDVILLRKKLTAMIDGWIDSRAKGCRSTLGGR